MQQHPEEETLMEVLELIRVEFRRIYGGSSDVLNSTRGGALPQIGYYTVITGLFYTQRPRGGIIKQG